MEILIQDFVQDNPTENLLEYWTLLKNTIRERTQVIATELIKKQKLKENIILKAINITKQINQDSPHIQTLFDEPEVCRGQKYEGALIRAKLPHIFQETPNKYFLSVERNIQKSRQITTILDSEGNTRTDTASIGEEFLHFYQQLYTDHTQYSPDQSAKFLQYSKQLDDIDKQLLDTPISLNDIKVALASFQKNKTPGPDGLTAEFYLHFFPILGPLMHRLYEEIFTSGKLPDGFNHSYIILIHKKDSDKTLVKNYRPISLLNTDYKILAKILTTKLKPFMSKLIHSDQQCSVPGRNISNHTHLIRDIIEFTHNKQIKSALLSLDQEKAFDKVSHRYLFDILDSCNLGPYFCKWIKLLYQNPESYLLINHTLTNSFSLTSSVRQGCPLSPFLYILTLEPALEQIRQNPQITGIRLPGSTEKKLAAYADDTEFFPSNNSSIRNILQTFTEYGQVSGARINVGKSQIMGVGAWKNKTDFPFEILQVNNMKIYGITFSCHPRQPVRQQWDKLSIKIAKLLDKFKYKNTTIFGRSVIVNTLVIPKIIYLANILDPPQKIIRSINKTIRSFVLQHTLHNVKNMTLIQKKLDGGIQLQDINTKIRALRIKYIGKIFSQPGMFPLAHYYIGIRLTRIQRLDNSKPHFFGSLPPFYRKMLPFLKDKENLIHQPTSHIYKTLVKLQEPPLQLRIKWGRELAITNFKDTFRNLHTLT